jgi:class 3 adenylate cyclase/tetratricopeptide (TPR) repeat protein
MLEDNRKLAAIAFVDIVGYTAMMSKNVNQTLELIDKIRSTIIEGTRKFHGNLLKELGDGFLLSFQSPSNAIRCGQLIHKKLVDTNASVRIGIHVGEIIHRNNDIYGDGVNIASRLQSIASPSSIYISGRVHEDILNNPEFHTKFQGEKKLKNVGRPIKVYEILDEASDELFITKLIRKHKSIFASSIIILVLVSLFSFVFLKYFTNAQTTEIKLTDEQGNVITKDVAKTQFLKKVVVFLFQNEGKSYDWMTSGIPMMITADLEQDVLIQIRDGLFYIDDYKRSGVSNYTKIPDNILRNIANVYKLDYFITGTFQASEANNISVEIKTYDTQLGKLLGKHAISGDDFFQLVDELSTLIKRDLGFEEHHIKNSIDLPISEILTPSFNALEDFSIGMENILINGKYRNGVSRIENAIKKDSIFTKAYYQLSNFYMNMNRQSDAKACLEFVLDNPYRLTEREQFLAKSRYYFITGDNDKRIKVLGMYKDLYPHDIESYNQLGEALYEMGNYEEAEIVFAEGLKIDDYRGEFLRRLGHINKAKRNYDQALKYYEMYQEKYPDVSRSYKLLGGLHLETGNFDEAEVNLEKAVLLDRRAINSRIDLIEIKQRKGQFDEAIEEYENLLGKCNTTDDSVQVMWSIMNYYFLRGEVERGLQIREKTFQLAATIYHPRVMSFYTVTNLYWYYEIGQDHIALKILKQEEEKLSDNYENITAFGYINYYLRKNDIENSRKQYKRISDFVDQYGSLSGLELFFRARLYKLEGEYEKAIETYEEYRLHNTYSTNAVIFNRMVECYLSNKQYDQAEVVLKEILNSFPFDPTTYYHLALVYHEQGKLNDAQASLKIANSIWENADEAYVMAQKAKSLYNQLEVNL